MGMSRNRSAPWVEHTQNYLHNRKLVAELVAKARLEPNDLVIEIGPGRGIITEALAERCAHVIAIEKDPASVARLQRQLAEDANVTIFTADILDFPMPATGYKVFANIPYNITAAIVGKLTSGVAPPRESYLVMQAEAAGKFMGQPRTTLASLLLHPQFEVSIVHRFARRDFRPAPAVDSVLVRFSRRETALVAPTMADAWRDFVTAIFTAWAPTVTEALRTRLTRAVTHEVSRQFPGSLSRKPGDLSHEEWRLLFDTVVRCTDDRQWKTISGAESRLHRQQQELQKHHRSRTSGRR
jgi:23S rRNA (adenine-N6)-dimethyltransferase